MANRGAANSAQNQPRVKAFQFVEGRPSKVEREGTTVDKENGSDESPNRDFSGRVQTDDGAAVSKMCPPSTPATRLPLADLIGNAEESSKRRKLNAITPEEHVSWQHSVSPGAVQPLVTPARKRKRARSSSPPSSQRETSNFFPPNGEAQAPSQRLRTPHADPAADLWSRYTSNGGGLGAAAGAKEALFAHLIRDASPRSTADGGSIGGLRRWSSCGVEWPTSASGKKRRKLSKIIEEQSHTDQPDKKEDGGTKRSRVDRLLQRMKETLAKEREEVPRGPSSSSPLPAVGATDATSPLERLTTVMEHHEETPSRTDAISRAPQPPTAQEKLRASSSEYGDVEIDADMLDMIDHTERQTQREQTSQQRLRNRPETHEFEVQACGSNSKKGTLVSNEFGEEDDEAFAADFELLASKYDSQAALKSQSSRTVSPGSEAGRRMDREPSSQEEFGDDTVDLEEFAAAEAAATQAFAATGQSYASSGTSKKAIQRYLIKTIHEGTHRESNGYVQHEKILVVEEEKTSLLKNIILRQAWFETQCTIASYVHVIGDFNSTGQCVVDNSNNLLILHPDHLISATVVADSFGCVRRAVLQDRVKTTSQSTPPLLYGQVLHELFQEAMTANKWDLDFLKTAIERILPRHFEVLVDIGLNLNQAREHLHSKLPEMQSWAEIFVHAEPRPDGLVKTRAGKSISMSVSKLLDVEEHVWSPQYGLKGNIDATVQVVMDDDERRRVLTVPFEVKTGKRTSESHVAQTALYTLLLSDRYDIDVIYGILYYLETSEISRVPAIRHELIHMIMKRNELACYVRERLKLPPMLKNSHLCNKCYAQVPCFLYNKLVEDGDGEELAPKATFKQLVRHLKPSDQAFFKRWDDLITKEESELMKFRRELWTMLSTEREKLGRCFSNLLIEPDTAITNPDASKINRYQYTFIKLKKTSTFSFAESQITLGEPIVISDEDGHFALANGYVTQVSKRRITVAVDRRLHNARIRGPNFDSQNNQDFAGSMEMGRTEPSTSGLNDRASRALYRLDKDEFSNGMATVRNNLLQIMDGSVFKALSLRSLLIENRAPTFKLAASLYNLPSQSWQSEMNSDQKAAIEKVMTAEDYALVLGMPGTGKTTTIAHIIRALIAKGKSVLLTSYTHTAVDNILLKVRNAGFDVLRLGVLAKVHPGVQEFAILAARPKESLEQLSESWHKPQVVATTCLGLNHPLFSQRTFDFCIVDEASQVTLPVCLGPIRMANTFILVGDHFQLPPLVQNKEALEGGLDMSLFRLLSERHPEAVVSLEHQYRMCSDVMALSNELIYSGRLKCGNEAVANRTLTIPSPSSLQRHHHKELSHTARQELDSVCQNPTPIACHLAAVLSPSNKVLFLNTDPLLPTAGSESATRNRIINPAEATLLTQLTHLMLNSGVAASDVGIVTFYRSQLALLRQALRSQPEVELHTADKFQGRDKEVVLVSFVRSNGAGEVGELLRDWRRVNVSITRARSKLILVGSRKTLMGGGDVLKGLVRICEERGWMYNLPSNVLNAHNFPEMAGTQGLQGESPVKNFQAEKSPKERLGADGVKSPVRRPLGEIDGRNTGSPVQRAKVPEKAGKIRLDRILKSKPVLADIMNDIMGPMDSIG